MQMALFGFETHHGYYKSVPLCVLVSHSRIHLRVCALWYRDLIAHINSIKDRNVVVTGHSLGGGIAHIAGAFTRRISVTFSPPGPYSLSLSITLFHSPLSVCVSAGILYSRRKFIYEGTRVQSRDAYHQSVSVIPDLDAVPLIDRQASLRQQVSVCSCARISSCYFGVTCVCLCVHVCVPRSVVITTTPCFATPLRSPHATCCSPVGITGDASLGACCSSPCMFMYVCVCLCV